MASSRHHEAIYNACLKEQHEGHRFNKALKIWQARSKQWQSHGGESLKRGLLISKQTIALSDKDKITVAAELTRWLEDNLIRHHNQSSKSDEKVLTITRARELAIDIMLILTPHLHLHNPEIQRAR